MSGVERVHVEVDFPVPEEAEELNADDYRGVLKEEFESFLAVDADVSVNFRGEGDE
ncbi:hypothetical protein HTZ84_22320 [Haloterrigena sp. SYSU A558-1]|uniref:Uncharacterized protein n=1 Tax=Haloterrigena gelatinilytica TaxID=2741724 RepID=A0ABX2LKQ5_9EURY|nr:hypothetical protein [Haloterrigena gelatinilytica]NUC75003.1 hypothetical protein [Haloterrigena gelatinilytica]